jgi:NAD-dependent DNA ligase
MSGSNLFGRGFSDKKMELILAENPDILVSTDSDATKIANLSSVKGIAAKTAESIVKNIPVFKEFLIECGLEGKLIIVPANLEHLDIVLNHPLNKKSVVLTGTRDKALMAELKMVGANLGSSVSKNTFAVIAATFDEDTGKAEDARRLGVPLFTPATFMTQYNL